MNQSEHCTEDICANTVFQAETKNKNNKKSIEHKGKKSSQGGDSSLMVAVAELLGGLPRFFLASAALFVYSGYSPLLYVDG